MTGFLEGRPQLGAVPSREETVSFGWDYSISLVTPAGPQSAYCPSVELHWKGIPPTRVCVSQARLWRRVCRAVEEEEVGAPASMGSSADRCDLGGAK